MRGVVLYALLLSACAPVEQPEVVIHVAPDLEPGARPAIDDLIADLARLSGHEVAEVPLAGPVGCRPGRVDVVYLGHRHDERGAAVAPPLTRQAYSIRESRCGDGHRVVLRGGSLLAGQWAAYDLLERLGVRYLHPERTLYPEALLWPDRPISTVQRPTFLRRSMHVHRAHPVELSAPLEAGAVDMAGYQRRWIDWNVKLRQSDVDGWDPELVGDYAYQRGFTRVEGFNLINAQQGGRPLLDADDPRGEDEQLAAAIDARMIPDGRPTPAQFGFQFNPSEFTQADPTRTVERLTFITDYLARNYPGVEIYTINHATAQEPVDGYGIRFFDLPERAPGELGVWVHTLMFYDLERPAAGVYGNADYRHLLDWMMREKDRRRVIHYPESSWWLTFDLPVPLYLAPVTLEARQHDIDLLAPHAQRDERARTGIWGHRLFTSGQEWGYWLIDYCVARMVWDAGERYRDCLGRVFGGMPGGGELLAVLDAVTGRQIDDLRDPEILRFLVGSDDETEAAARVGIQVHPLPPAPSQVLAWNDLDVAMLEVRSLAPLRDMAVDYHRWADRIEALIPELSPEQAPWVREVRDGLRVFALRAEHAVVIYESALALREALAVGDLEAIQVAATGVDEARMLTEVARSVVRERERDYRYPPALTIIGGEPGTGAAVPNRTVYPYRYLSRTHRLFYWERPDRQLAALFGHGLELVRLRRRVLRTGEPVEPILRSVGERVVARWEPGMLDQPLGPHRYRSQGLHAFSIETAGMEHRDQVAVADRRVVFPRGSLRVDAPAGVARVEGLLPGLVVGLGDDGAPFMVLGRVDGAEPVAARGSLRRRDRRGAVSGPADLRLELADVGPLTVAGATLRIEATGGKRRRLRLRGRLSTDELVERLVSVGGFDRAGARELIADLLGYSDDTLPAWVPFAASAAGVED